MTHTPANQQNRNVNAHAATMVAIFGIVTHATGDRSATCVDIEGSELSQGKVMLFPPEVAVAPEGVAGLRLHLFTTSI